MTAVPSPFGEPLPDAPEASASPNARFLAGAVPHGTDKRARFGNSIIGSACTHIGGCLLALFIVGKMPVTPPSTHKVDDKASDMVWLSVPGSGRRGADAGDGKPEPLRKAERARPDTLPVATPPAFVHEPADDLPKPDPVIIGTVTCPSHSSDPGERRGRDRRGAVVQTSQRTARATAGTDAVDAGKLAAGAPSHSPPHVNAYRDLQVASTGRLRSPAGAYGVRNHPDLTVSWPSIQSRRNLRLRAR